MASRHLVYSFKNCIYTKKAKKFGLKERIYFDIHNIEH